MVWVGPGNFSIELQSVKEGRLLDINKTDDNFLSFQLLDTVFSKCFSSTIDREV